MRSWSTKRWKQHTALRWALRLKGFLMVQASMHAISHQPYCSKYFYQVTSAICVVQAINELLMTAPFHRHIMTELPLARKQMASTPQTAHSRH